MKTPGLLLAATVALAAPPRVAAAAPSAALDWHLPPYATREGDLLTIDVPESAARQGCRVEANVDLSAFDGMVAAVESGQISQARLDESVLRILRMKLGG